MIENTQIVEGSYYYRRKYPIIPLRFLKHENLTLMKDAFAYRKDKRMRFLQRLCLWILKRLGCYDERIIATVETFDLDLHNLSDAIHEQMDTVYRHSCRSPKYLILGKDIYERLLGECNEYFRFNVPIQPDTFIQTNELNELTNFMGMTVVIVPWIKGFCILPKDFIDPRLGNENEI